MEGMLSSSDQQRLVSSFLEIAVGQTAETARQFLEVGGFVRLLETGRFVCSRCYSPTDVIGASELYLD